jgi:protein tyrosine phosphatase
LGRTGTFVILDSIVQSMKKNKEPPTINLMKTLRKVREMRNGLVQTFEQYHFIYKTILEHVSELTKKEIKSEL